MTAPPPAPSSAAQAAREILRRLHEVMSANVSAQAKLNRTVQQIGEALDSEVCSIYLLREGVLELFATRGLKQEAVHVTKLALGEGLVGSPRQHREPAGRVAVQEVIVGSRQPAVPVPVARPPARA